MPRSYVTLAEHPGDMVRLACTKCDRRGQYRKATLLERYGPDQNMGLEADPGRRVPQDRREQDHGPAWRLLPRPDTLFAALAQSERVRSRMAKRKGGKSPGEARDAKAERIYATAMAIIEMDTESTQAKTERLRALRLAKEAGTTVPEE
jgi:hypothetical protein